MNQTVSIVVPVYNVKPYLENCINSLLSQTYETLEILLVDDGSPDGCGAICDTYAQRDRRVKVIHKENAGLGFARNTGLDAATGDFVCFVDSDDWLAPEAVETWLRFQNAHHADIVMCGYQKCQNEQHQDGYVYRQVTQPTVYREQEVGKYIFLPMIGQPSRVQEDFTVNMCVWTNLYRHSIIEEHHIRFLSERAYLSEDICFNLEYLLHAGTAVVIPDLLYRYRYNPTSLTNRYKGDEMQKLLRLYERVCYWASQADAAIQTELEYRSHRFLLTKCREVFFRLACSDLPYREKLAISRENTHQPQLQKCLKEYPLKTYALKYKLPALLMKYHSSDLLLWLFYLEAHRRGN